MSSPDSGQKVLESGREWTEVGWSGGGGDDVTNVWMMLWGNGGGVKKSIKVM